MNDLALLVRLQAEVAKFLAGLSSDLLVALAEGRVTLTVLVDPSSETATVASERSAEAPVEVARIPGVRRSAKQTSKGKLFDADAVVSQLFACETLDEATELLAALDPSLAELKLLAKTLKIPAARTKNDTAKRILTLTVGARSKHAGLRQG